MKKDKYAEDGVNIKEGDDFSAYAGNIARATNGFCPFIKVIDFSDGHFRGPRGMKIVNAPRGSFLTTAADGPGTKVILVDAAKNYPFAAHGPIAMTGMDIVRYGGVPVAFNSVLDVSSLGEHMDATNDAARQVIFGVLSLAKQMRFIVFTGETAELGPCVGSENPNATLKFNWAGFMIGLYHRRKMILGKTLREGQIIMALKENGFGDNGIGSVRKALRIRYGDEWWANPKAQKDIRACAAPSAMYDLFLTMLHGWHNPPSFEPEMPMHLIVHLSGGAFESKLAHDRLFRLGLSATIDNLFEPADIMRKCAKWRGMSERECYKTWNGGQRGLVVIDRKDEKCFVAKATAHGVIAQKCGNIIDKPNPSVIIESKFGRGETITIEPEKK